MGKIIGFEIKKLISRIGIYLLILLLAGLLVVSAYMYKPEHPTYIAPALAGDTVSEMYANFELTKTDSLKTLENISYEASTYIKDSDNYNKYNNKETLMSMLEDFDAFCILYTETSTATTTQYSEMRNSILEKLQLLKIELFNNALDYKQDEPSYYILTTTQNYNKLQNLLESIPVSKSSFDGEAYINQLRLPIYECFNKLVYPNLEPVTEKYVDGGAYYNLVDSRLEEIAYKIEQEYKEVVANPTLEKDSAIKKSINQLFEKYSNCLTVFEKAFNSSISVNALSAVSDKSERANLYIYGDVNLYEQENLETTYIYYLENNMNANNFANSLSVTHTSNTKTNAYDFTFFVMSIFTVAIILFAIYLASHTVSGEISNNSMRFTAIRPVTRGSLFFGKYFAIVIMSAMLLLFSTVTSLCVGGIIYGFDSLKILMVFNGNTIFVAHPLLVITIFTLSNMLLIMLYTAVAILFSTALKSELLAMLISVIIYAGNLVLPLFFGATSWLRFYPLVNVNLFAYFGSTRLASDSVISQLFNTVVYQGMSIWITIVYIIGITTILLALAKIIFKKRQF